MHFFQNQNIKNQETHVDRGRREREGEGRRRK
jgi:hypothetical protein